MVISNISKRANVLKLVEVGMAFGCAGLLVVGQERNWTTPSGLVEIPVERFDKWNHMLDYLRRNRILLVGIEIHPDAMSMDQLCCLYQDTALVVGNEGTGLLDKQINSCDSFVRIPQFGVGTASLNVYVAASTVLYHLQQQNE